MEKMAITMSEAKVIKDELLAEGFELNEVREYMEHEYELVEAEYKGDTTKVGYIASMLGGFPGFLIYMWYKKGARRRFIGDVGAKFGKNASDELAAAITKYNLDKSDKSQLSIIRKWQEKLKAANK